MSPAERHRGLLMPKEEVEHRVKVLRSTMEGKGVDLVWLDFLTDRIYFAGSIQNGVFLIPAEEDPKFFVKKSVERAEAESPLQVEPYPGRKGLVKRAKAFLGEKGRLGMAFDVTPASTYAWLKETLGDVEIIDVGMPLRLQKAVKSGWEIAQIERAAEQAVTVFKEMGEHFHAGMTELDLSGSIESRLRFLGHGGTLRLRGLGSDLPIITAVSGDSALFPTNFDGPSGGEGASPYTAAGAGWRKIREGDTVIVDMVTSHNGYYADNARIFFVGNDIPERARQAHAFCLNVLSRLESSMVPGKNCSAITKEIQAWVESQGPPEGFMGYGENRVKFFGHGVGLELDEFPILAEKMDLKLEPGMVIAVEPKAYLKGIGPVGVENTYVIAEKGCRSLCAAQQGIVGLE